MNKFGGWIFKSNKNQGFLAVSLLVIILLIYLFYHLWTPPIPSKEYVNVYNWYGVMPPEILRQFEEETGITVRYDLFDNNEVVEAKLFSGNSGYDVVFPSACPYVTRHVEGKIYAKLNRQWLPNLIHVDPEINEKMRTADPTLEYAIPYYWGTFGFLYVEEIVKERIPDAPVDSYAMLFDPKVVSKLADCGVTLLDEAIDVYPAVLAYIGKDPQSGTAEDLQAAQKVLQHIRPYIKRFSSFRFINEIVAGDSCVAQAWSGDAQSAQKKAEEVGRKVHIRYVVPKEGGVIWIDSIAIPRDAPNLRNAHIFINFLLRPDISAHVSNSMSIAIANKSALPLIKPEIRNDETIYPAGETLKRFKLDMPHPNAYEEKRTRLWGQVKAQKPKQP